MSVWCKQFRENYRSDTKGTEGREKKVQILLLDSHLHKPQSDKPKESEPHDEHTLLNQRGEVRVVRMMHFGHFAHKGGDITLRIAHRVEPR